MSVPLRFFAICLILTIPVKAMCFQNQNDISGKWISTKNNVIIDVYKVADQFHAKVLWYDDRDDLSRPMRIRIDAKNPENSLRNRLILGMDVLDGLVYNPQSN